MYNNPTAKQLAHLVRKKPKGFVYQFGNTDMRIPMTYYKAHLPKLVAPTDPKSLWEELGYSWVTTNRKADIVVCGDLLLDNFDIPVLQLFINFPNVKTVPNPTTTHPHTRLPHLHLSTFSKTVSSS